MAQDVYAIVTEQIIEAIEAGAGRWQMPWHSVAGAALTRPVNAQTGNAYRGVNVVALWASAASKGYETGTWATFKQWKARGAQVQRGQKGTMVAFYKQFDATVEKNGKTEIEKRFMARASFVFNAAQVDGWTPPATPAIPNPVQPIQAADAFIKATGADIRHGGASAHYSLVTDHIQMPPRDTFTGTDTSTATESYYGTLLHELIHWTGPESRCKREFGKRFGDDAYAFEELIAELGAAFLCGDIGINQTPRADHAAYINSWLRVLKGDKKAIFNAASAAAKATDYLETLQK